MIGSFSPVFLLSAVNTRDQHGRHGEPFAVTDVRIFLRVSASPVRAFSPASVFLLLRTAERANEPTGQRLTAVDVPVQPRDAPRDPLCTNRRENRDAVARLGVVIS